MISKLIIVISIAVLITFIAVKGCEIICNIIEREQTISPIEVSESKYQYYNSQEYRREIYPLKRKVKQLELKLKLCKGGK